VIRFLFFSPLKARPKRTPPQPIYARKERFNRTDGQILAMQIPIKRAIEKVPGGMMIVPLAVGSVITTFAPHAGAFFGSFTGALFTGALPILAVFYVCIGAKISVRSLPRVIRKGGALMATKFALGLAAGFCLGHLIGVEPIRTGWFAGISALAVVAAVNDTNGGLYMSLMEQYGSSEDSAAYSVMALESGPFLTMLSLGAVGLSAFPWQTLVGAILPLAVGMLLGNLDPELRTLLSGGVAVLIPFFAFALGTTLNLHGVWEAGLLGLALGLVSVLVCATCLIFVDRLIGGNGTAGIAASTTAGNAAAVPILVAAANPHYANAAAPATVLVGASIIVSSILIPPLTAWWKSRVTRLEARKLLRAEEPAGCPTSRL
jgi:2-keto-3-deoxygluconate permease